MTSYTNRKGRTIKYDYTQVDNLPYIRKILYGEAGSVYNDSIVFTYRNVTDDITRYVDGKAFKYSRLLEKVESFYKSTLWIFLVGVLFIYRSIFRILFREPILTGHLPCHVESLAGRRKVTV